ncbi:hypothetical protein Aco03nite_068700 [Actinoplanes couchii]|uniref:Uncharacterized protein n=1 Tax=Actinoplanes couchii TaxID=403638 RepID=A0ABQ3XIY4_9ACTN|nr:hypothetical protein Aco03nite_068700 [Actinoplanes couchii]
MGLPTRTPVEFAAGTPGADRQTVTGGEVEERSDRPWGGRHRDMTGCSRTDAVRTTDPDELSKNRTAHASSPLATQEMKDRPLWHIVHMFE